MLSDYGVEHITYPIDDEDIPEAVSAMVGAVSDFCKKVDTWLTEEKRVLVSCAAGVSRSVTMVIAYLIHRDQMVGKKASLFDYISYVKECRSCSHPNMGFLRLL